MFWLVDSDIRPVWLKPVDAETAREWLARGEAFAKIPADTCYLTFATRHGQPARYYLFPREEAA